MKNYISIFGFMLCGMTFHSVCVAQSVNISDSLFSIYKSAKVDSVRVSALNNYSLALYRNGQNDSAFFYIHKSYDLALKNNYVIGIADAKSLIAMINYDLGNYSEAIDGYFEVLKIIDGKGLKKKEAAILGNIGNSFKQQKNYEKALEYQHKALELKQSENDEQGTAITRFNIANLLKQQGDLDKALSIYNDVVSSMKILNLRRGLILAHNNIGNIYTEREQYDSALVHLKLGLDMTEEVGDYVNMAYLLGNLGDVYIAMQQPQNSLTYVQESMSISQKYKIRDEIKNDYYRFSVIDSIEGNFREALKNYKTFVSYRDSLFNEETIRETTSAEMRFQFHKKEMEDQLKHEKKLLDLKWKWAVIVFIMVLGLLLSFGLYFLTRIKKKKEKQIFAAQNRLLEMKKTAVQNELNKAQEEIHHFIENIDQKNDLIQSITSELEESYRERTSKEEMAEIKVKLTKLKGMHILTDDDWITFLKNFDMLYPRFTMLLRDACPKITTSEIRYLMLSKIGLGHKQMASMLGISTDAVRVTWNRVRNKLGGSQQDMPQSLLAKLGL